MTQKERLIELLCEVKCEGSDRREGGCGFRQDGKCNRIDKLDMCMIACIAERLLENGVIVPMYKVGDKVEILDSRYEKQGHKKVCTDYVATGVVDSIVVGELGIPQYNVCYGDNEWTAILDARDIGDTTLYAVNEAEEARRRGETMVEIEAKSYIESRLDFFKAQRDKAKRKYERLSRILETIEAPTIEDWRKVEEVAEEYKYYIDVVVLLENAPAERSEE